LINHSGFEELPDNNSSLPRGLITSQISNLSRSEIEPEITAVFFSLIAVFIRFFTQLPDRGFVMKQTLWGSIRRLPLHAYISLFIILIIIVVTIVLCGLSYSSARDELLAANELAIRSTEQNALRSQLLVDKGLDIYDDSYNEELEARFPPFLEAYKRAGGDPGKIDLDLVRQQTKPFPEGKLNFFVINKSGVIVASTVPGVMNLDFKEHPDYFIYLSQGISNHSFFADRVSHAIVSTASGKGTGELTKWAFMPTPDHAYLLEIGLVSPEFNRERGQLSAVGAAEELRQFNPNLVSVRVFNKNRFLLTKDTVESDYSAKAGLSGILTGALAREDIWTADATRGTKTHYLLINFTDDDLAHKRDLVLELTYSDTDLKKRLTNLMLSILGIGAGAILLGITLSVVVSRHITGPISRIIDDTDRIAAGDLDHPIRALENPEFHRLEKSLTVMIRHIRESSAEIEHEKSELRIAAGIQKDFLPETFPQPDHFSIAAKNIPAKEVGGDFFDVIPLEETGVAGQKTGILIGDVSGKGMPAALFMALSGIVVRVLATRYPSPSEVITAANTIISASSRSGMFVTLFYGVLATRPLSVSFVNAGHNPPLLFRAGNGTAEELPATGIALGVIGDRGYREYSAALASGDVIVLYTDGITEAMNAQEEMFGTARLIGVIGENRTRSPQEIIDAVIDCVLAFSGSEPQYDDITIMVVKVV
jgi:serine phosphatase RsbU (regulator of sigma subunit)